MSTPAVRQPRPTASSSPAKVFTLADVSTKAKPQPKRMGIYAGGGFGKSSLAANFPSPIFLMTRGETGLLPLIESGLVPETSYLPELQDWSDLIAGLDLLLNEEHKYRTLVLDTANGAERLLHEHVCHRDFSDDWGERGFTGYMRGFEIALADWRMFLNKLDALRAKGMTVLFLMHARIKTFKNPNGADYDKYTPEMHEKTWSLTKGWLDCTFFGNFEVSVMDSKGGVAAVNKRGKAAQQSFRILYTNPDNPTYDAKNRLGLPDEIEMGDSAKEGFSNLVQAMKAAKPAEKESQ